MVMLTTSPNPSDIARAQKAGVAEYINKTLTEQKLQEILDQHLV